MTMAERIGIDVEEWTGFKTTDLLIMAATVGLKERIVGMIGAVIPESIKEQVGTALRVGADDAVALIVGLAARRLSRDERIRTAGSGLILDVLFDAAEAFMKGIVPAGGGGGGSTKKNEEGETKTTTSPLISASKAKPIECHGLVLA